MATWTATIDTVTKSGNGTTVSFSATILRDAVVHHTYGEPNVSIPDSIPKLVKQHLIYFDSIDNFDPGTVKVPVDINPPPPIVLTDVEKARIKFQKDLATYRGMLGAVKLTLLAADAKTITDQLALLQSEFLPEYVEFLGNII